VMLVYRLPATAAIYGRFGGVSGSAYFIGGFGMTALTWISQTYRCIGAENLRKMLCCNSFYEVEESPDADRVYAEAV
jgi:hypothetical protein